MRSTGGGRRPGPGGPDTVGVRCLGCGDRCQGRAQLFHGSAELGIFVAEILVLGGERGIVFTKPDDLEVVGAGPPIAAGRDPCMAEPGADATVIVIEQCLHRFIIGLVLLAGGLVVASGHSAGGATGMAMGPVELAVCIEAGQGIGVEVELTLVDMFEDDAKAVPELRDQPIARRGKPIQVELAVGGAGDLIAWYRIACHDCDQHTIARAQLSATAVTGRSVERLGRCDQLERIGTKQPVGSAGRGDVLAGAGATRRLAEDAGYGFMMPSSLFWKRAVGLDVKELGVIGHGLRASLVKH